jgi:hypothetical protein
MVCQSLTFTCGNLSTRRKFADSINGLTVVFASIPAYWQQQTLKGFRFIREAIELVVIRALCSNGISLTHRVLLEEIFERQCLRLTSEQRIALHELDDIFI